MSTQPRETQKWMLGIDSDTLINTLELMENLHFEEMKSAPFGSQKRAEHRLLAANYQRAVWAMKYDKSIGRIQS